MSKEKISFVCSACGAGFPKWTGQCQECEAWNTLSEQRPMSAATSNHRFAPLAGTSPVTQLCKVKAAAIDRTPTGIAELDRVLGGGVVEGMIVLLAGEPGAGKSTLLLQALEALQRQGTDVLYVSGEESQSQISMRAHRLGFPKSTLLMQAEIQLERILESVDVHKPSVLCVDSIQTVWTDQLSAAPGSVSQVRECAAQIARVAKQRGMAVFMVGHVTKTSDIAGPMALNHMVDTVLMLEGDQHSAFRIARAMKNRFGAVNEVGVFSLGEHGMKCVSNPSAIFMSNHTTPVPGSCIMATIDGTRPMLVEIQALVDGGGASPRRLSIGLERDRLAMLLAVLSRHGAIQTAQDDVFVNAVGGLKISEPAADLAVLLALQSSIRCKALPRGMMVFGEVGLAGEVRPASKGQDRLREGAKLGFSDCVCPKANAPKHPIPGLRIHPVDRIDEALQVVRNWP